MGQFAKSSHFHVSTELTSIPIFYAVAKNNTVWIGYPTSFFKLEQIPARNSASFNSLVNFWKNLQSNDDLKKLSQENIKTSICNYIVEFRNPPKVEYMHETCGIFGAYFKYSNCSDFEKCILAHFYSLHLGTPSHRFGKIFPFTHEHREYIACIFPKKKIFRHELGGIFETTTRPRLVFLRYCNHGSFSLLGDS